MTQTVLLGDLLVDLAMGPFGSNLKADNFIEAGVPVIKGGNLYGYEVGGDFSFVSEEKARSLKRSLAYPDDIVVTHRGTLGQVSIVPHGKYPYYLASQSQLRMSLNKNKVNPRYLLYYMKSAIGQHELMQHAAQVGVPSIATPTKAVKTIKIILPKLQEQQKIVEILGKINEKIELNRQMNETLEQMGQALFKHYFIDNPETEKLEGKPAKDVLNFKRGIEPGSKKYEAEPHEDTISFYRVGDLTNKGSEVYIKKDIANGCFVNKHNVLVSFDGAPGMVRVGYEGAYSSGIQKITSKHESISSGYIYFYMKSPTTQRVIDVYSTGTTIKHAGKSIDHMKIFIPKEQKQEVGQLDDIVDQIILNINNIAILSSLRDSLLPRLISGELKV